MLLDDETPDKQCLLKSYLVSLYFCILLSSLEWDKYIWNGIRDEGALALTDHRIMRNITKLKSVTLHGHSDCFYICPFVYLPIVIIVVMVGCVGGVHEVCCQLCRQLSVTRVGVSIRSEFNITSSYHFQTCRLPEQDFCGTTRTVVRLNLTELLVCVVK